jgi:hypothetical protein
MPKLALAFQRAPCHPTMKRFPSYVVVACAALALTALTAGSSLPSQNVQQ